MFRPLRDPEFRNAILFVFGLSAIALLVISFEFFGGPEPPKWAMIVLGAFAFGPAAVTSVVRAWRGAVADDAGADTRDTDRGNRASRNR